MQNKKPNHQSKQTIDNFDNIKHCIFNILYLKIFQTFITEDAKLTKNRSFGLKLSNGHSRQIRETRALLARMCRGESHFSQKLAKARVRESGESAQHGSASLASPRNTARRMSASLASPCDTSRRMLASLASPRDTARCKRA